MSEHRSFCPQCGAESAGPFCSNCGARRPDDDAPTSQTAATIDRDGYRHDEPTAYNGVRESAPYSSYTPSGAEPTGDSDGEYSSGAQRSPAYGNASATASSDGPRRPNRTNQALVAIIAVVTLVVAGMLGFLFTRHKGDDRATSPIPSVTASSSSSSVRTSSSSPPTSSTAPEPSQTSTREAQPTQAPQQPTSTYVPPASAPETSSSSPSSSDDPSGFDSLSGVVQTTTYGGPSYALQQNGRTVTVYTDNGGNAVSKGSFTLQGSTNELSFLSLPSCSAPVVVFNAAGTTGSAAYAIGSGGSYQALTGHADGSLVADGGTGAVRPQWGVNASGSQLEFRGTGQKRGQGDLFDYCQGTQPDALHKSN